MKKQRWLGLALIGMVVVFGVLSGRVELWSSSIKPAPQQGIRPSVQSAQAASSEAESLQAAQRPETPLLYSPRGYAYVELLLERGEWVEARRRGAETLPWMAAKGWLLEIALDHLSLGRSSLVEHAATGTADLAAARRELDAAVAGLRRAGAQHQLPRGLLARAALFRLLSDLDAARRDLTSSEQLCTRGGLRLLLADTHLEWSRLHLAAGDDAAARPCLEKARELVNRCGYHRRTGEVADLEGTLAR